MESRERIGLFGGSFDPIHTGHLILAESAVNAAGLDRVVFMPTALPPHKSGARLSPFDERREMVELAIADNHRFELSLLEARDRPVFTYESIAHYRGKGYGREQIHLVMGSDSLGEISGWRHPERIFENATIIAMRRSAPGEDFAPPEGAAVIMIESCSNSISSSAIRAMIREGKSIRYLVPDAVERFIRDRKLYLGQE
ncbi:MAG TPA: nicotinate (nicotinamide) nucleotide adenylyltransferase [Candidatus Eisenbacteria bacterium]|uniref:Probable nicotinate-nucleotide adenylyltransferase n=1 Tax=Eiseniibacteriota bacterium TaxID=2212470 RepID=A0A7V2AUK5_UNCEI|nr:nicotinate (nicotinamide) nucleotide adenylyltransferase [Candidatus Eisenbacteria bacterium]